MFPHWNVFFYFAFRCLFFTLESSLSVWIDGNKQGCSTVREVKQPCKRFEYAEVSCVPLYVLEYSTAIFDMSIKICKLSQNILYHYVSFIVKRNFHYMI